MLLLSLYCIQGKMQGHIRETKKDIIFSHKMRRLWWGEVTQTMYTHVSECKKQ
jgi:hypothetical protein